MQRTGDVKNHTGIGDLDGGRRGNRRRWSTHMVALVAIALSFMVIPTAGAQDGGSLEVPVSTVVRTAPGVETTLASAEVPTEETIFDQSPLLIEA